MAWLKLKSAAQTLVGLALVIAALAAFVWLLALAIREGANLVAAVLAAVATVGGAVLLRYFDQQRAIEAARREQLGPQYEQFASVMAGQETTDTKRRKTIETFQRRSLILAGPKVLITWQNWLTNLTDDDDPPREQRRADALRYEEFVKAMRADLGVSNRGLGEGDLGRAAVSDWDEYFGPHLEFHAPLPPESNDDDFVVSRNARGEGQARG